MGKGSLLVTGFPAARFDEPAGTVKESLGSPSFSMFGNSGLSGWPSHMGFGQSGVIVSVPSGSDEPGASSDDDCGAVIGKRTRTRINEEKPGRGILFCMVLSCLCGVLDDKDNYFIA